MRGDTILEVNDFKACYEDGGFLGNSPVKAVDGVSLDIQHDGAPRLAGESGRGKSTLGRTLTRLEEVTAGEVELNDTDITTLSGSDLKQPRKDVQMISQNPDSSLSERMTMGEIIHESLDVHDWKTPSERRERVRELLETTGLQEQHYYRYPYQFSGGQCQRTGIARALVLEPEFVTPDGLVSTFDMPVQAKILNLLEDLQSKFGLTYLFTAYDLAVVRHVCDHVAVIYLGSMMEIGPADEMSDQPVNPYTHVLLLLTPESDPTIEHDRITLRGTPLSPCDPPAGCPFSTYCLVKTRPEAYRDMDPEFWKCIEVFRGVLWECSHVNPSLNDCVRKLPGRENHRVEMDEIIPELSGDLDASSDVMNYIYEAAGHAGDDDEDAVRTYPHEEFDSVCDRERPGQLVAGNRGRSGLCRRHETKYKEPTAVFETLV